MLVAEAGRTVLTLVSQQEKVRAKQATEWGNIGYCSVKTREKAGNRGRAGKFKGHHMSIHVTVHRAMVQAHGAKKKQSSAVGSCIHLS